MHIQIVSPILDIGETGGGQVKTDKSFETFTNSLKKRKAFDSQIEVQGPGIDSESLISAFKYRIQNVGF